MGDTNIYNNLLEFTAEFLQLGWLDLKLLSGHLKDSRVDVNEFAYWCADYCEDIGIKPFRIDLCALLLEYIKDQSANELIEKVADDRLEVALDCLWVYSNYLDSWYRDQHKLLDILDKQDQSDWSHTLTWFYNYL